MAPILQSSHSLKPFTKSNNVNTGELYTLGGTRVVEDIGGAEKHSLATPIFATLNHIEDNPTFLVHNSSPSLRLLAENRVSYKATSGNTMQMCGRTCVSMAVVISLGVLLRISIGLFLSLFSQHGRIMNSRWWTNNGQRRTGSSVVAAIDRRRSIELLRLHPHTESTLPPFSESTVIPETNRSPNLNPRIDNRMNDQSNTTLTDYVVCTRDTSPNASPHIHEIPSRLPPAPRIPTIQLPLVEDEIDIIDTHISPFYLQCDSEEANISEPQLEARCKVSPGLHHDHSNDGSQTRPDGYIGGANADPNSNLYSMPIGSLGLIFG